MADDQHTRGSTWPIIAVLVLAAAALLVMRRPRGGEPIVGPPLPPLDAAGWLNSSRPLTKEALRGKIVAIDLNTGEHLWWIPNGDTPEFIKRHPDLQGLDIPNPGQPSHATALVTKTLLIYGEGRGAGARLHAHDKKTGARIATVELPAPTNTAPMTYMHEGTQYIVVSVGGGTYPGAHVALALSDRLSRPTRGAQADG